MNVALRWPRTLASRLSLIFLIGLILAQALSFGAQYYERYESAKNTMLGNLETDVSTSIAILDRLPAEERPMWLKRLARKNYGYLLSEGEPGTPLDPQDVPIAVTSITDAIGEAYPLTFTDIPGPKKHFQGHLRLSDGSPVTIDVRPSMVPLSPWLPVVLPGQLALMLAGGLRRPPRDVADALAAELRSALGDDLESASVAGPGFLNLRLSDRWYARALSAVW